ncbi:hypothetical protein [Bifidobacterium magnum]|nr:hypothetical protein [Bifidobacterium magnum]
MKPRKDLDRAAKDFAERHGDRIGKPEGIHNGLLVYNFLPEGCIEGGCVGVLRFIVVDVNTGMARYQTVEEIRQVNVAPVLDHLDPIPD